MRLEPVVSPESIFVLPELVLQLPIVQKKNAENNQFLFHNNSNKHTLSSLTTLCHATVNDVTYSVQSNIAVSHYKSNYLWNKEWNKLDLDLQQTTRATSLVLRFTYLICILCGS